MIQSCRKPQRGAKAREYVLGALPETEAARFEDHLAGCTACADRVLEEHRALDRLADALPLRPVQRLAPPEGSRGRRRRGDPRRWDAIE